MKVFSQFPLPHSRGSSHGQSRGIRRAYPDPFFSELMIDAYKEWHSIEEMQRVKLIRYVFIGWFLLGSELIGSRETGLLCFSDEEGNPFLNSIINSFEKTPGSDYFLYQGKDFHDKFPYLNFGEGVRACFDPSGGVVMADKALRAVQV